VPKSTPPKATESISGPGRKKPEMKMPMKTSGPSGPASSISARMRSMVR